MSKFSQRHYQEVADVIRDWIRIKPNIHPDHSESLINGFILTFKADNNKFDRRKFEDAVRKEK